MGWPELPLANWKKTYETLHRWVQIVGKIRLSLAPHVNHWWECPFYVTSRGLTTSIIPYCGRGFEILFDFTDHTLVINTTEGQTRNIALAPKSVGVFYHEVLEVLSSLNLLPFISPVLQEIPNGGVNLDIDQEHDSYDRFYVCQFFRILVQADRLLKQFRSPFMGKASPVHFFWGSFDLAVSLFSGRRAPERPGADRITREGYSHELMSFGFWPGSGNVNGPAFYAYAAPEPAGFNRARMLPEHVYYNETMHNYILMYEEVIKRSNPDRAVLDFFRSVYVTGANLGDWDRKSLERPYSIFIRKAA